MSDAAVTVRVHLGEEEEVEEKPAQLVRPSPRLHSHTARQGQTRHGDAGSATATPLHSPVSPSAATAPHSALQQLGSSPRSAEPAAAAATAVPFPSLPHPPRAALLKAVALMQRGTVFTKYSYRSGAPHPALVFFAPSDPDDPDATDADISVGNIYWNCDTEHIYAEDPADVDADAGGADLSEEKKQRGSPGAPAPDPSQASRLKYARSVMRCIPLVSVIEVRRGEELGSGAGEGEKQGGGPASLPVQPMDPWAFRPSVHVAAPTAKEAQLAAQRRRAGAGAGGGAGAGLGGEIELSVLGGGANADPDPIPPHPPGFPSYALSQSFARWTLQPWMNVETFRAAQKRRRALRKIRRRVARERAAAGLPAVDSATSAAAGADDAAAGAHAEEAESSENEDEWGNARGGAAAAAAAAAAADDDDDEDDLPSYTYTPPPLSHCLTVVTAARTLDLVAPTTALRDVWVWGLRALARRGCEYYNGRKGLAPEATGAALSMSAAEALGDTRARRAWRAAHAAPAPGLWGKLHAVAARVAPGVFSSPSSAARSLANSRQQSGCPTPLHRRGLSRALTPDLLHQGPNGAGGTGHPPPPGSVAVSAVEVAISCRHLAPPPLVSVSPPSQGAAGQPHSAPCVLVYGLLRRGDQTEGARALHLQLTRSGAEPPRGAGFVSGERAVYLGKTERITPVSLQAALRARSSSASGSPDAHLAPPSSAAHPNFLVRVLLRQAQGQGHSAAQPGAQDEFDAFHFVVHDSSDLAAVESSLRGNEAPSSGSLRRPGLSRAPSSDFSTGSSSFSSSFSSGTSSSLSLSLRAMQACPVLGWARVSAAEVALAFGRELVTTMAVPSALSTAPIDRLDRGCVSPPPVPAPWFPRCARRGGDGLAPSSPGGTGFPRGSGFGSLLSLAPESADQENDGGGDGRTVVTDAMLDAYKAHVLHRHARREARRAADPAAAHARNESLVPPMSSLAVRPQVSPLLLLRPRTVVVFMTTMRGPSGLLLTVDEAVTQAREKRTLSSASSTAAAALQRRGSIGPAVAKMHLSEEPMQAAQRDPLRWWSGRARSQSLGDDSQRSCRFTQWDGSRSPSTSSSGARGAGPSRHRRRHSFGGFAASSRVERVLLPRTSLRGADAAAAESTRLAGHDSASMSSSSGASGSGASGEHAFGSASTLAHSRYSSFGSATASVAVLTAPLTIVASASLFGAPHPPADTVPTGLASPIAAPGEGRALSGGGHAVGHHVVEVEDLELDFDPDDDGNDGQGSDADDDEDGGGVSWMPATSPALALGLAGPASPSQRG